MNQSFFANNQVVRGNDLAIDLGTANTVIYARGRGIVLDQPSVVAVRKNNGSVIAAGDKARDMLGRTPDSIIASRPLRDGVIADFQAAESMIEGLIGMIGQRRRFMNHMKMVICIPSGITEVEKRAVFDSADHVDSKETYLIFEQHVIDKSEAVLVSAQVKVACVSLDTGN